MSYFWLQSPCRAYLNTVTVLTKFVSPIQEFIKCQWIVLKSLSVGIFAWKHAFSSILISHCFVSFVIYCNLSSPTSSLDCFKYSIIYICCINVGYLFLSVYIWWLLFLINLCFIRAGNIVQCRTEWTSVHWTVYRQSLAAGIVVMELRTERAHTRNSQRKS